VVQSANNSETAKVLLSVQLLNEVGVRLIGVGILGDAANPSCCTPHRRFVVRLHWYRPAVRA